MPSALLSRGLVTWTCLPSNVYSPLSKEWMPAIPLIRVLLPAPLSPTSAVTLPGVTSRSTPRRTWTGPKLLLTPRRLNSGSADDVGRASSAAMVDEGPPGRDALRRRAERNCASVRVCATWLRPVRRWRDLPEDGTVPPPICCWFVFGVTGCPPA